MKGRLRRLVMARDRYCQFPGCARRASADVHHIRRRFHKGDNALSNLTVLCRFRHQRVHEGGWRVIQTPRGLEFEAPDGRATTR